MQSTAQRATPAPDRFDIPKERIPEGMSYQWVTVSVLGREQPTAIDHFKNGGWLQVPLHRHADLFPDSPDRRYVECDGLALMEMATEEVERRRAEMTTLALSIARDAKTRPIGRHGGDGPIKIGRLPSRTTRLGRLHRRALSLWFGLTEREMETAVDGTLIWNTGEKRGHVLGMREVSRRNRIMRK